MTFNELVAKTMDRLNLSSTAATSRIRERINEAYREVTSAIGLDTSRKVDENRTFNSTTDTDLPSFDLLGYEKVNRIAVMTDSTTPLRVIPQVMYDDVILSVPRDGLPTSWAVKNLGASTVTIILDGFPPATDFILRIDGYAVANELIEDDIPAFPESFHDVLIEHALCNELRKMEKDKLALIAQQRYEKRLSDLRMFVAKSAYLDIQQGQTKRFTSSLLRRRGFFSDY